MPTQFTICASATLSSSPTNAPRPIVGGSRSLRCKSKCPQQRDPSLLRRMGQVHETPQTLEHLLLPTALLVNGLARMRASALRLPACMHTIEIPTMVYLQTLVSGGGFMSALLFPYKCVVRRRLASIGSACLSARPTPECVARTPTL